MLTCGDLRLSHSIQCDIGFGMWPDNAYFIVGYYY